MPARNDNIAPNDPARRGQEIQDLICLNRLEEACRRTLDFSKDFSTRFEDNNTAILFNRKYNEILGKVMNNQLTPEEHSVNLDQLSERILLFINMIIVGLDHKGLYAA